MYTEQVMDHFTNPRNVGEIEDASGVGEVGNMRCGDIMRIYLKVNDQDVIEDIKFRTFGCAAPLQPAVKLRNWSKAKLLVKHW